MRTTPSNKTDPIQGVATPVIGKTYWPYPLIWLVPILAAVAAGFYYADAMREHGPEITIKFADAEGLKPGQTPVTHLGVTIGMVIGTKLAPDQNHVLVSVQLHRSQSAFAAPGSQFWIVRPEISTQTITGLGTVFSGPYIDSIPGSGASASGISGGGGGGGGETSGGSTSGGVTEFTGLDTAPLALGPGVKIVLHAPRLERLAADSVVYFRGIQVGVVQDVQISSDGAGVDIHAFIWKRYAPLVRSASKFWVVAGIDVKGGIFTGISMKIDSLRAILSGGVAFATPEEDMGDAVSDGAEFPLADDAKVDWLKWAPKIPLGPDDGSSQQKRNVQSQGPQGMPMDK